MTVKNTYPLPLILDIIGKLRHVKIFLKMNVRWGFNNIRIKEGDEYKAAFLTNRGLFKPTVMFFGLCNSPATFQTMMNNLLKDLILQGVVMVYMDDILVFTKDLQEHRKVVLEVLEILEHNKLYLKPEKCEFKKRKIEYLGVVIGDGKVEMDPAKLAAIEEWPAPTTIKETQSFLGFCNFYQKFIQSFATIAQPLYRLTQKNQGFRWTTDCTRSFRTLKDKLVSAPVLTLATDDEPYKIEADASDYASGAMLSQRQGGE